MHLSLVVPVYNEKDTIQPLFAAVQRTLDPLSLKWEIIFVDDGSRDGSLDVLRELAGKEAGRVRVVVFRRNFGQTAALMAGPTL